ncbi:MAG TPA: hypothetical protein IAC02_03415 [Candidatus Coprovivens excrementavium]|nr:hypothetical protein [Candidatus Coprovivens excrementavium]
MNAINILERIEDNGFEAYIVGGYVRDYLLGINSSDVDICTNARVRELLDIFSDYNVSSNEYGAVKLITNDSRIDITTYRRDLKYNGSRRRVEIEYVDNLLDDINRRDFTMNTLCMNKEGNIIDVLNGKEDIEKKIIRCVGNIDDRLNEDPLRMLRAVRFATTLNFEIEEELYKELKRNRTLIAQLSRERIKEELNKILTSTNALRGLKMMRNLGFLDYVGIDFNDNLVYVSDICGMYSQLTLKKEFPFSKEEKETIKAVKNILNYGIIDENVIFTYGLYVSLVAGSILGVEREYITSLEKNLPIKRIKDIKISSDEICSILNIKPNKIIHLVYDELKDLILKGKLINDNNSIKEYLMVNRKKWLNEGASLEIVKCQEVGC